MVRSAVDDQNRIDGGMSKALQSEPSLECDRVRTYRMRSLVPIGQCKRREVLFFGVLELKLSFAWLFDLVLEY
jgi:hypothetical protein